MSYRPVRYFPEPREDGNASEYLSETEQKVLQKVVMRMMDEIFGRLYLRD